jgi:hypothetical protein
MQRQCDKPETVIWWGEILQEARCWDERRGDDEDARRGGEAR